MAIGGMGGLGGFNFPNREGMGGAPASRVVQSDEDFHRDWQGRLSALIASNSRDAFADPGVSAQANADMKQSFINQTPNSDNAALSDMWDWAQSKGVGLGSGTGRDGAAVGIYANPYTQQGLDALQGSGVSHTVSSTLGAASPGYAEMEKQYADASRMRSENQTRQQQAYDTNMMGNNAVGGVMPANYSDPNYGQITGQKTGGLGGLGGMGGVDMAQQSGAYMGGAGSYNPNPFAPGSFKSQSPWGNLGGSASAPNQGAPGSYTGGSGSFAPQRPVMNGGFNDTFGPTPTSSQQLWSGF